MSAENQAVSLKQFQAYGFELKPSAEQAFNMGYFANACRFTFNKALSWNRERGVIESRSKLNYADLESMLSVWCQESEFSWVNGTPVQLLQQAVRDFWLEHRCFLTGRADRPRFRRAGGKWNGFRYVQDCKIDQVNSRIYMPGLNWVRYCNNHGVFGTVKSVTVYSKYGVWQVSIQTVAE